MHELAESDILEPSLICLFSDTVYLYLYNIYNQYHLYDEKIVTMNVTWIHI